MAHSISQAFTKNKSDELYTPKLLVDIIQPYVDNWYQSANQGGKKPELIMPFDTEDSEFVHMAKEHGYRYKCSHIDTGTDFFDLSKPKLGPCLIVSNPPFSKKLKVLERLFEWNWPFAMVMNLMCLNYMEVGTFYADHNSELELIIPNKRISFDGNPSSFCSAYFCRYLVPDKIHFVKAPHCNSGKDFVSSRMYV